MPVSVVGVRRGQRYFDNTETDTENRQWRVLDNRREIRVKIVRAYGGCPGIRGRRRTRQAAKSHGELRASVDPWESEWGNPS